LGWRKVKLIVDTNVLVRAVVADDVKQARIAAQVLKKAEMIAIPLIVLCEFVWVLRRVYDFPRADIAAAIRKLLATANVEINRPAVSLGLNLLESGGDFADGVICHEGQWLGGARFVSFDKDAVKLLKAQGQPAELLG
jgi:predicted nucleic-acid-binding protein